jgi:hypothetical protein
MDFEFAVFQILESCLYDMIAINPAMRGQMKALKFTVLQPSFTIHRLEPGTSIPKAVFTSLFYSISQTDEELSIVAPETVRIESGKSEAGWNVLKIAGPLDFSMTGVLANIAATLAAQEISIFAISTFDTDYILVKSENLKKTKTALIAAGHKFGRVQKEQALEDDGFLKKAHKSLLEKQIPFIKQLFMEKINPSALTTLRSEAAMAAMVGGLYEFLPTPVRLVINRDVFVHFCVNNLDKILPEAAQPAAKNKKSK